MVIVLAMVSFFKDIPNASFNLNQKEIISMTNQTKFIIILVCLLFSLFLLRPIFADTFSNLSRTTNKYYSIEVVNDKIWIVGERGTILQGTIGRDDWGYQDPGVIDPLNGVDFIDSLNGAIVGGEGLILKTEDGGKHWNIIRHPKKVNLLSVKMVNKKDIWAVGDYGTVLSSHDGGKTWVDCSLSEDVILNGIFFLDSNRGWIVGERGTILLTKDGGTTWVKQELGDGEDYLYSVLVWGTKGVITGACGVVYLSSDGGENWERHQLKECKNLFSAAITSENQIIVVGDTGLILNLAWQPGREIDSKKRSKVTYCWLKDLKPIKENSYVTCGNQGVCLISSDNGRSWNFLK